MLLNGMKRLDTRRGRSGAVRYDIILILQKTACVESGHADSIDCVKRWIGCSVKDRQKGSQAQ